MRVRFTCFIAVFPFLTAAQFGSPGGETQAGGKDSIRCGRDKSKVDCNEELEFEQNTNKVYHKKSGKPFTGQCESCHSNGNRENVASFRDGREDGESRSYYADGAPETLRHHANGVEIGEWKFWYPTNRGGKLAWEFQYLEGKLNGKCMWYFEDANQSVKKVEHYNRGILDGKVTKFYAPDKLKSEIEFKNGIYHGAYKTYFENGQISIDKEYSNGREVGDLKHYYDNGQISLEGSFQNGQKHDKWAEYYRNGVTRKVEMYNNGVLDGQVMEHYEEDGKVKREALYQEGYLMSEFLFDEFGNFVDEKGRQLSKQDAEERDKIIRATAENRMAQGKKKKWWKRSKKKKDKTSKKDDKKNTEKETSQE